MANIRSSEKKNRQRIRREARNRGEKSGMRTAIKKLRGAIEAKNVKQAKELLSPALKLINRAGRKGVIKPNAASRAVSRLTGAVTGLGAK